MFRENVRRINGYEKSNLHKGRKETRFVCGKEKPLAKRKRDCKDSSKCSRARKERGIAGGR